VSKNNKENDNKDVGVTVDEKKGEIKVELPFLDRHEQARWDRAEDFHTEYGGGNSIFGSRDFNSIKAKISKAQDYFVKDSLVRRLIELMAQFSSTPVQLKGPQKYKAFFKQWMSAADVHGAIKRIFKQHYLSGNTHIVKSRLPFKGDIKENKKLKLDIKGFKQQGNLKNDYSKWKNDLAKSIQEGEAVDTAARKIHWTNKMLPYRYTVLNPLQIEKYGEPTFGLEQVFWTPNKKLRIMLEKKDTQDQFAMIINSLPIMLTQQIKEGESRVELYGDFYNSICRMKDDYESYAEPLMTPIFNHLFRKDQMREADLRVVKAVINKILLIRVGDKDYPATAKQLQAISAIFKNPSDILELIWNHAINISWIDTDDEFLNKDKYKPVNEDIMEGFGITKILVGNTEELKGDAWISLRGLVENISDAQEDVAKWLKDEFEEIGDIFKLDSVPEPTFTTVNLEDKVNLYKIYQSMVDRGIISNQVCCELIGEDWRRNFDHIKKESKLREKGVLPVMGSPGQMPASKKEAAPEAQPGQPGEQKPTITPSEIKGAQGRPPGTPTPISNRTPPRKKNAADIEDGKEGNTFEGNLTTLAKDAVQGLFERFRDEGKTENEAVSTVTDCMSGIVVADVADFDAASFKINGGPDLTDASVRNLLVDLRNGVSSRIFEYKRKNPGKEVTSDDKLEALAETWAVCMASPN